MNKRFFDAVSSTLTVFNATEKKDWVQLYRGIAAGLGKEGFNFEKCVEDGNQTVAVFKESFNAFKNKSIFKGLQDKKQQSKRDNEDSQHRGEESMEDESPRHQQIMDEGMFYPASVSANF